MSATLYEVPGPWKGKLAVVPRPRGGDWLEDDIRSLRAVGMTVLVSALTPREAEELGLADEQQAARTQGIDFVSFPIEDRSVPSSVEDTAELVHKLSRLLSQGRNVALHCRSGIGRSTILAAALLSAAGVGTGEALAQIERVRGLTVPDTLEQRRWVEEFAKQLAGPPRRAAS